MKIFKPILIFSVLIISKSCKVPSVEVTNEGYTIIPNEIYKTNKFLLDNGKEARKTLIFSNENYVYYNYYGALECSSDDLNSMMKTNYKLRDNVIQFEYKDVDIFNKSFTMIFSGVATTDSIVFSIQNIKDNNKWIITETFYHCIK